MRPQIEHSGILTCAGIVKNTMRESGSLSLSSRCFHIGLHL